MKAALPMTNGNLRLFLHMQFVRNLSVKPLFCGLDPLCYQFPQNCPTKAKWLGLHRISLGDFCAPTWVHHHAGKGTNGILRMSNLGSGKSLGRLSLQGSFDRVPVRSVDIRSSKDSTKNAIFEGHP